jgi:hypothetical protein
MRVPGPVMITPLRMPLGADLRERGAGCSGGRTDDEGAAADGLARAVVTQAANGIEAAGASD